MLMENDDSVVNILCPYNFVINHGKLYVLAVSALAQRFVVFRTNLEHAFHQNADIIL